MSININSDCFGGLTGDVGCDRLLVIVENYNYIHYNSDFQFLHISSWPVFTIVVSWPNSDARTIKRSMIRQLNADKFAMFFENMYIFMYITITGVVTQLEVTKRANLISICDKAILSLTNLNLAIEHKTCIQTTKRISFNQLKRAPCKLSFSLCSNLPFSSTNYVSDLGVKTCLNESTAIHEEPKLSLWLTAQT